MLYPSIEYLSVQVYLSIYLSIYLSSIHPSIFLNPCLEHSAICSVHSSDNGVVMSEPVIGCGRVENSAAVNQWGAPVCSSDQRFSGLVVVVVQGQVWA